ncbi:hypothetical protein NQ317_007592 [Molorchus minor]|uniref:Uncharacterized protein n=1 Tax=Molorchus minor TaxID=1323400 RepID=A0ABQ9JGL4_9CUCU|nr:hypothetical protein NQ317_007592 [Molorchus minor]
MTDIFDVICKHYDMRLNTITGILEFDTYILNISPGIDMKIRPLLRNMNINTFASATEGCCTMNNCESEEIVEAANIAISNLLPTKSRSLYDIAYNRFKKWCAEKNVQVYSENVLLAYFSENAKNYKSSTIMGAIFYG